MPFLKNDCNVVKIEHCALLVFWESSSFLTPFIKVNRDSMLLKKVGLEKYLTHSDMCNYMLNFSNFGPNHLVRTLSRKLKSSKTLLKYLQLHLEPK